MGSAAAGAEYVGALIEDENRLVLVPVDPGSPWDAFKRLRSWMRRAHPADASLGLFEAPVRIEPIDNVIPLAARRRSG